MEYTIEDLKKAFEAGQKSCSVYFGEIDIDYQFEDWITNPECPVIVPRPRT